MDPKAVDLLSKMLNLNAELRITAKEALAHPYFAPVDKKSKYDA